MKGDISLRDKILCIIWRDAGDYIVLRKPYYKSILFRIDAEVSNLD